MIEQAVRRFCEAKHRKLIVIAGTFIVGLLLVLPLVDVYSAGVAEKEDLTSQLESAQHVARSLKGFEARVTEKLAELKVLEERTIDDESLPALRVKLVDLAKETGCSIRKLSVGTAVSRPWQPGQNPIGPAVGEKKPEAESHFQLEWRPVNMSLSGTSASLRSMVEKVAATGMMLHTKSFEMYPSSPTRQSLTLDIELWCFTLARKG
jgi:hypothetical protein